MDVIEFLLAKQNNHKVAIKQGEREVTYHQLNQESYKVSKVIENESGQNVGLFIPNSIEYIIGYFGILFAHKTNVILNAQLTVAEIELIAAESDMKTLVTISTNKEAFKVLEKKLQIVYVDEMYLEKSEEVDEIKIASPNKEDIALIFPTSGTTGLPKLVMYSHETLMTGIEWTLETMLTPESGRELVVIPLCAAFINTEQMLLNLYVGATIILYEGRLKLNKLFNMFDKEKITRCSVVPSVLKLIAEYYNPEKHHIEQLDRILIAGEKIDEGDFIYIKEKLAPVKVIQSYGMTEASTPICHKTYEDWDQYPESVGRTVGEMQLKVIDGSGKTVKAGELGEILITSPYLMKGYYGKSEAFLKDGWLYTGDIGYKTEEGYVYIMGRKKNVIISGGRNIFPEEVEAMIRKHKMIHEIKVYGEKSESSREIVVADIEIEPGEVFDLNALSTYCQEHLAFYKIPKHFYVVEEIEKTASNKIKRR